MARKGKGQGQGKLGKKPGQGHQGLGKKPGSGNGPGMGGEGIGEGGQAPESKVKAGFDKTKVKGQFRRGEILGSLFVKGTPSKGEAKKEYSEAMGAAIQESTDALTKEDIPAGYKKLVKDYFDSVETKEAGAAKEAPAGSETREGADTGGDKSGEKK